MASESVTGTANPAADASTAVESQRESGAPLSRWRVVSRHPRAFLVVGAAAVVLVGAVWVTRHGLGPSIGVWDQASSASSEVQGYTKPISHAVVVLKLTGASGESWSLRSIEGAMATYAIAGQPKLGLSVAFQSQTEARLSFSSPPPVLNASRC